MPVKGRVKLKDPDICFQYTEYYGSNPNNPPDDPQEVFFGRWVGHYFITYRYNSKNGSSYCYLQILQDILNFEENCLNFSFLAYNLQFYIKKMKITVVQ